MSLLHWVVFWSGYGASGPPFDDDLPDGTVEAVTQAATVEAVTQPTHVERKVS